MIPFAVSWGLPLDGTLPRTRLTAAELTELGTGLCHLLTQFDGYVAAKVGWDPESFLDLEELRTGWMDELADDGVHGLVLSQALHSELGLRGYVEFQARIPVGSLPRREARLAHGR